MRIWKQIITVAAFAMLIVVTISLAALATSAICNNVYAAAPTTAQMDVIQNCAAKQGVNLPAPPSGGPAPHGENSGPPNEKGPTGSPPPMLTDAQRTVIDACFKASGLTPPQPPQGRPMREN